MLSNLKNSARLFLLVAMLLPALAGMGAHGRDHTVNELSATRTVTVALLQLVARFRVSAEDVADVPQAAAVPMPADVHGSYIPRLSAS